jgi:hypothetical protein
MGMSSLPDETTDPPDTSLRLLADHRWARARLAKAIETARRMRATAKALRQRWDRAQFPPAVGPDDRPR